MNTNDHIPTTIHDGFTSWGRVLNATREQDVRVLLGPAA